MTHNRAKALEAFKSVSKLYKDFEQPWFYPDDENTIIEALSEPQWKTMDSAPRDANEYLGWFPDLNERRVIWWCSAANFSVPLKGNADGFWNSSRHSVNQPTHWMPLPDAPTGEES